MRRKVAGRGPTAERLLRLDGLDLEQRAQGAAPHAAGVEAEVTRAQREAEGGPLPEHRHVIGPGRGQGAAGFPDVALLPLRS